MMISGIAGACVCVGLHGMVGLGAAVAADYPQRPVRMVVPFAAGSNIDGTARQIMPKFAEILGQQVVVDNRGGAGGTIGATLVMVGLAATGIDIDLVPPREFAAFTKSEVERYRVLIAMAGAKM